MSTVTDAVMRRLIVPVLLRSSPRVAYGLAERLGSLRWRTAGAKRRRVERRIREILSPRLPSRIDEVGRGVFVTQMKSRLREMPLADMSDEAFASAVVIEGRDVLDEAMARGKGVILVGAHFGPGRLIAYALRRLGYPVVRTGYLPRDPVLRAVDEAAHARLERRTGLRFEDIVLPPRQTAVAHAAVGRRMLVALLANRVLYVAPDGRAIANTVLVPVLGRRVGISRGWVSLAQMTGATAIPAFAASRCRSASLLIRLEAPIPRDRIESADPLAAVGAFAERLEAHIRRFPCNAVFLFLDPHGQQVLDGTWGRAFWPTGREEPGDRVRAVGEADAGDL